jgi:hypothetical protein
MANKTWRFRSGMIPSLSNTSCESKRSIGYAVCFLYVSSLDAHRQRGAASFDKMMAGLEAKYAGKKKQKM